MKDFRKKRDAYLLFLYVLRLIAVDPTISIAMRAKYGVKSFAVAYPPIENE